MADDNKVFGSRFRKFAPNVALATNVLGKTPLGLCAMRARIVLHERREQSCCDVV
jgi:hypothetical protein